MRKNKKTLLIFSIVISLAGFCIFSEVRADVSDNVSGWAWSENIGWVSFNCTNQSWCATSSYGVNINNVSGEISGNAWSDRIGWISFDKTKTGTPPAIPYNQAESYIAKISTVEPYGVLGWAKALSASSSESGGWDGWIKFNWDTGEATGTVSLDSTSNEFEGFAWGGDPEGVSGSEVIGWLSFNDKDTSSSINYQVISEVNFAPTVSDLSDSYSSPCSQSRIPDLSWEVSGSDPNYDYQIQICSEQGCGGAGDPIIYEMINNTASKSWLPSCSYCCNISPYNGILWGGGVYYWRVKVRHTGEIWSEWISDSDGFLTKYHCYPYSYFLCSYDYENWYDCDANDSDGRCEVTPDCIGPLPFPPPVAQKFYIKDFSTCHNLDNSSFDAIDCSVDGYNATNCPTGATTTSYNWTLFNASSTKPESGFATSILEVIETGTWKVSATTTDSHSPDQECGCEEEGESGLPLPEWIEVAPY